jgi:hypothetical protein
MATIVPIVQAIHERSRIRQPRKGCLYNSEELLVMNKHKEAYRSQTTQRDRESLLRTAIFVDIFNYWDFKQIPLDEKEIKDRMQVWMSLLLHRFNSKSPNQALSQWIRNNWRPHKKANRAPSTRKASYLDIVWRDMQSQVLEEIKALSQNTEPAPQEKFKLRTTAARHVYESLTSEEKASIKRKTLNPVKAVNPPEIQQR